MKPVPGHLTRHKLPFSRLQWYPDKTQNIAKYRYAKYTQSLNISVNELIGQVNENNSLKLIKLNIQGFS